MNKWINLIAIVAGFLTNILANTFPPNGETIADISNTVFKEVLIVPASYAFAIWGLIYLGLISLGIYQLRPSQQRLAEKMGYYLTVASVAQIAWVIVFLYRYFTLSLIAMIAILIPLILLYQTVKGERRRMLPQTRWFIYYPISLYTGWITIATIVNVALTLYALGWRGGWIAPEIWTVLLMIVATGLAFWREVNLVFKGVIVWALIAIALRHLSFFLISGSGFFLSLAILILIFRESQSGSRGNQAGEIDN